MSLETIAVLTLIAAVLSFWWQSDKIKRQVLRQLILVCRRQGLQLLDQTMVLRGLWLQRNPAGTLAIRRRYLFEFASTGEARYKGRVVLLGRHIVSLEMEPHIIPGQSEPGRDQLH